MPSAGCAIQHHNPLKVKNLTRTGHNYTSNVLVNDMQRRNASPGRIAIAEVVQPRTLRPIPYANAMISVDTGWTMPDRT